MSAEFCSHSHVSEKVSFVGGSSSISNNKTKKRTKRIKMEGDLLCFQLVRLLEGHRQSVQCLALSNEQVSILNEKKKQIDYQKSTQFFYFMFLSLSLLGIFSEWE